MSDIGISEWHRLEGVELAIGEVTAIVVADRAVCVTRTAEGYGVLDNHCPHQGGPLGEGQIEDGCLICPWHGYEYDPTTGQPPSGYSDAATVYPSEMRSDGLYVQLPVRDDATTLMDQVVEVMTDWGVTAVFGMVGHSNLGLADAMRRAETDGRLRYFGIRHEGAAAFAASAYGKLTGNPAACFAIAGPGATNLLTGLWDAKVDRAPILALTGQVQTQVTGPGAFQEIPTAEAFSAVAAYSQTVLSPENGAELMALAIKHAVVERDVAHLIFPDDVQNLAGVEEPPSKNRDRRIAAPSIAPAGGEMARAVELLRTASRPTMIVGNGARPHRAAILELAEKIDAPIITTFKAKGIVPDDHPLACGTLGRSGIPVASAMMGKSDCLLVLGASFSNHTGISAKKPTIQIDFDPMTLGKFHPVDVPVWGEIGVTCSILKDRLSGKAGAMDQRPDLEARWSIWREEKQRRLNDDRGRGVNSSAVFAAMNRQVPDDAIIAVDVGDNTYSFGRYFECTGQSVLMSGYLGSIGFALPAAMGAWAATQEDDPRFEGRRVVSVSGDGGLGQYLAEITTAVKYSMNITHVVLNNNELGKISKEQRAGNWDVWQTSLHNPSFSEYARLCGALGIAVHRAEELDEALTNALDHDGMSLVEIHTDAELV